MLCLMASQFRHQHFVCSLSFSHSAGCSLFFFLHLSAITSEYRDSFLASTAVDVLRLIRYRARHSTTTLLLWSPASERSLIPSLLSCPLYGAGFEESRMAFCNLPLKILQQIFGCFCIHCCEKDQPMRLLPCQISRPSVSRIAW